MLIEKKERGRSAVAFLGLDLAAWRTLPSRQRRKEIAPGPIGPVSALDNARFYHRPERCNETRGVLFSPLDH